MTKPFHIDPTPAEMLAGLILGGALQIASGEVKVKTPGEIYVDVNPILIYLNLSDVFSPGIKHHILEPERIKDLFHHCEDDTYNGWGHYVWACKHYNQKPVSGLVQKMKEDNVWPQELDELPANHHEASVNKTLH